MHTFEKFAFTSLEKENPCSRQNILEMRGLEPKSTLNVTELWTDTSRTEMLKSANFYDDKKNLDKYMFLTQSKKKFKALGAPAILNKSKRDDVREGHKAAFAYEIDELENKKRTTVMDRLSKKRFKKEYSRMNLDDLSKAFRPLSPKYLGFDKVAGSAVKSRIPSKILDNDGASPEKRQGGSRTPTGNIVHGKDSAKGSP